MLLHVTLSLSIPNLKCQFVGEHAVFPVRLKVGVSPGNPLVAFRNRGMGLKRQMWYWQFWQSALCHAVSSETSSVPAWVWNVVVGSDSFAWVRCSSL
jgi:hypothetical protein